MPYFFKNSKFKTSTFTKVMDLRFDNMIDKIVDRFLKYFCAHELVANNIFTTNNKTSHHIRVYGNRTKI